MGNENKSQLTECSIQLRVGHKANIILPEHEGQMKGQGSEKQGWKEEDPVCSPEDSTTPVYCLSLRGNNGWRDRRRGDQWGQ